MKLASIEKILEIKPIDGADKIQAARVLGYWTVIKKGEFQVDDWVLWHEGDTIIDKQNPIYSFLKDERIKVIRLKKQVSQGLALPPLSFPGFSKIADKYVLERADGVFVELYEGMDITKEVGIKKYEKPLHPSLSGEAKGNFPIFLVRTDEENIRSNPKLFREFNGLEVSVAAKINGSSGSFFVKDGEFGVCSRNIHLKENDLNSFWKIARKYDIENKLKSLGGNIALQGEVFGPGIQGNNLGVKEIDFCVFDIFNIDKYEYFEPEYLKYLCEDLEIPYTKSIYEGIFNFTLDQLVEFTNALKYPNGAWAEGCVIRSRKYTQSDALGGKRLSAKIISENHALKNGE